LAAVESNEEAFMFYSALNSYLKAVGSVGKETILNESITPELKFLVVKS
jgi:hypothetical protein